MSLERTSFYGHGLVCVVPSMLKRLAHGAGCDNRPRFLSPSRLPGSQLLCPARGHEAVTGSCLLRNFCITGGELPLVLCSRFC